MSLGPLGASRKYFNWKRIHDGRKKCVVRAAKCAVRAGRGCNNMNHIDKNFQSCTIL